MSARITLLACLVGLFGCRSSEGSGEKSTSTEATEESGTTELPEDWWDDGDWDGGEGDGEGDGEGEGEGEGDDWEEDEGGDEFEEPHWYGFFEDPSASSSSGEVGWLDQGCVWYAFITGEAVDPCPSCSLAFSVRIDEVFAEAADDCEFDLDILTSPDFEFVVGFSGEEALEYDPDTDSWETFAYAFYEGDIIGWYAEL